MTGLGLGLGRFCYQHWVGRRVLLQILVRQAFVAQLVAEIWAVPFFAGKVIFFFLDGIESFLTMLIQSSYVKILKKMGKFKSYGQCHILQEK